MLYPKIGIRPVIDGRWGGVRESLENQTMRMAENAAKLISENLKYPDGTPVQCVIGCTTIGGGAEAARVAEQFSTQNVTATLSVTPCWCYGTETFDMDPNTIKAVWGFNGTERPGAVYGIALLRLSIPTWTISTFCLRPHHKYNYPNWLTIIKLLLLDLFVKTLVSNSNRIIGSHIFGAIVTLCVAFRTEQNRL